MDFISHIKEALGNLVTSKLRSFLAILGILVGTASVVALITSSQLATASALAQFKTLGTNLIAMSIQTPFNQQQTNQDQTKNQLSLNDMIRLQSASSQIVLIAPYTNLYQSIYFSGKQMDGQVLGATEALADIVKIDLAKGRFVSYLDQSNFYAVIGSDIAKQFQQSGISNPIGKQIIIGKYIFTVVGVAKPWKPNWFLFATVDKGVIIPLMTSFLLSKYAQINNLLFRLIQNPDIDAVQNALQEKMSEIHPNLQTTFRNPDQIIDIMQKQQSTFTWLLASIGGISLLVGGIGVMNIMLVSVVERRREIGIRMAIGARRSDIRQMFLIEAIILTVLGGVLGIILGIGISTTLAIITGWGLQILVLPPVLGFVVSVVVGIVSGFYPAYRASNLDPIETLRGE